VNDQAAVGLQVTQETVAALEKIQDDPNQSGINLLPRMQQEGLGDFVADLKFPFEPDPLGHIIEDGNHFAGGKAVNAGFVPPFPDAVAVMGCRNVLGFPRPVNTPEDFDKTRFAQLRENAQDIPADDVFPADARDPFRRPVEIGQQEILLIRDRRHDGHTAAEVVEHFPVAGSIVPVGPFLRRGIGGNLPVRPGNA